MRNSFVNFLTPKSPKSDLTKKTESNQEPLIAPVSLKSSKELLPQKNIVSEEKREQQLFEEKKKSEELQEKKKQVFFLERQNAIKAVQKDPLKLESLEKFKDDKEIVIEAIKLNPKAFKYVSSELKENVGLIIECYKFGESILSYVTPQIEQAVLRMISKTNVIEEVKKFPHKLQNYPEFQGDKEVVEAAIQKDESAFKHATFALKNDVNFIAQYYKPGSSLLSDYMTTQSTKDEVMHVWQQDEDKGFHKRNTM